MDLFSKRGIISIEEIGGSEVGGKEELKRSIFEAGELIRLRLCCGEAGRFHKSL